LGAVIIEKIMIECSFIDCENPAEFIVVRMAKEEERNEQVTPDGYSFNAFAEIRVCNYHLQEAQIEYPHLSTKDAQAE